MNTFEASKNLLVSPGIYIGAFNDISASSMGIFNIKVEYGETLSDHARLGNGTFSLL